MGIHNVLLNTVQALLLKDHGNVASKFNGNHLDFLSFITGFENTIGATVADPRVRLKTLFDALGPRVQRHLRPCLLVRDAEAGYTRAIETLYRFYGHPHHLTDALMSTLKKGRPIREGDLFEEREFYIAIAEAHDVLVALGERSNYTVNYLNFVSNAETIEAILRRIPFLTK